MSTRTIIACDECSRERTETNHWFAAVRSAKQPMFMRHEEAEEVGYGFRHDLCGRECAQASLERWLDTGSILKPETGDVR